MLSACNISTTTPSASSSTGSASAATTPHDVEWFIDTVLLGNIVKMIETDGQHYLGFGTIGCAIEFIGACIDSDPFDEERVSRRRFESAIKTLFPTAYHPYASKGSAYDLYSQLRCGMAHIMRPQGKVGFTTEAESKQDGTSHLQVDASTKKLVLVSENLLSDFKSAVTTLKTHMAAGAYLKKLSDDYLTITDFSATP
jgi:hypothetical protein